MEKLIGGILLAVGTLIAGVSGLCSLMVLGSSMLSPSEWSGIGLGGFMGSIGVVLVVGGIPFAIGAGMFMLGRKLIRSAPGAAAPTSGAPEPTDESASES